MPLEVVDFNAGNAQRECKPFGEGCSDEQASQESRSSGEGDGGEFLLVYACALERCIHHGQDVLLVGAACQLGDYAAVFFVHLLPGNDIAEQDSVSYHRCRSIVATGFYG